MSRGPGLSRRRGAGDGRGERRRGRSRPARCATSGSNHAGPGRRRAPIPVSGLAEGPPGSLDRVADTITDPTFAPTIAPSEAPTDTPEEAPSRPVTDDGDHDRFAHFARKDDVTRAYVTGEAIVALCGKKWVPDP